jgi:PadR family transcriptional regulator PadR
MEHQDLLSGLIRLHVLHHAVEGELYGQWMIEELARHGYKLSAGTLYPMLKAMEKKGYLVSEIRRDGRTAQILPGNAPGARSAANCPRQGEGTDWRDDGIAVHRCLPADAGKQGISGAAL